MSRMTRKQRIEFLKSLDFSKLCPKCGYRIPESELFPIDSYNSRCPKCGEIFRTRPEFVQSTS